MKKIIMILAIFFLMASLVYAKTETDSLTAGSQVIYGKDSSTLVPIKVASDGTVATSAIVSGTVALSKDTSTLLHNTVDFSASQTAQAIWTPATGKKFVITDIVISCSAAGTITVFDNTDSTENRVVKGYFAANGGLTHPYSKSFVSAAANNVLKYTTGSGIAGSITVSGYEE